MHNFYQLQSPFQGTDIDRSFHVDIAACHLGVDTVHSTFLRQSNGSIPRVLLTSFSRNTCASLSESVNLSG